MKTGDQEATRGFRRPFRPVAMKIEKSTQQVKPMTTDRRTLVTRAPLLGVTIANGAARKMMMIFSRRYEKRE